jgi:hypothetical protein
MSRRFRRALATAAVSSVIAASTGAVPAVAQGGPQSARRIVICHGRPPPCETAEQLNEAGDEHEVSAVVTDAAGAPVPDVPVAFREEGVGRFTTGADSTVVLTDEAGIAETVVVGDEVGYSYVSAEISPPGTPGGFRTPAAGDDACEQPAGPNGEPAAGNCVAGPLRVYWEVPPPPPECSDGIDNDGDGATDYPDDPSCVDELYDSEATTDPSDTRVLRTVTLGFSEWRADRMVVFGRVRMVTPGPSECTAGAPVRILRRSREGRWVPLRTVTTSGEGWYVLTLPDRPGRYLASALRFEPGMVGDTYVTCVRAKVAKRHPPGG